MTRTDTSPDRAASDSDEPRRGEPAEGGGLPSLPTAPGPTEARDKADSDLRERIVRALDETPGLNKHQLARRLDVEPNAVEHHLDRLEAADLVLTRKTDGGEVLCFNAGHAHLWRDERVRPLFGHASTRQVALYVAEHPGARTPEVAEAVDLANVTVLHHLKTLRESDLVERSRYNNVHTYRPTQALEDWLEDVGEGYRRPWEDADG